MEQKSQTGGNMSNAPNGGPHEASRGERPGVSVAEGRSADGSRD